MNTGNPAEHLVRVLRERDIPLTEDDVLWAFQSSQTKVDAEAWVREYLQPTNLLSKDEVELFRKVSRTSIHQRPKASDAVLLEDDQIKSTIAALQNSTAMIDKQCEALRLQKVALLDLQTRNRPKPAIERSQTNRHRQQTEERHQLNIRLQNLASTVNDDLLEIQKKNKSAQASLALSGSEFLNSDDRIMGRISKIVQALKQVQARGDRSEQVEKWCTALSSFRTALAKANVERTSKFDPKATIPSEIQCLSKDDLLNERAALIEELDTLKDEIASVAEMGVEHGFRQPINRSNDNKSVQMKETEKTWLEHVCALLQYMLDRLDATDVCASDLLAFKQAVDSVNSTTNDFLRSIPNTAPSSKSHISKNPVLNAKPHGSIPEAISRLHRQAGFPQCANDPTSYNKDLQKTTLDRTEAWKDHHHTAMINIIQALGQIFEQAGTERQDILGPLYCHTRYNTLRLSSTALDSRADKLDCDMNDIKTSMASVGTFDDILNHDKVDDIITRWSQTI